MIAFHEHSETGYALRTWENAFLKRFGPQYDITDIL